MESERNSVSVKSFKIDLPGAVSPNQAGLCWERAQNSGVERELDSRAAITGKVRFAIESVAIDNPVVGVDRIV
jgi:hypothetical protein